MLSKIIENEAFGSPFIIEGESRDKAYEAAVDFAKKILLRYSSPTTPIKLEKGSHPDFLTFKPEGTRSMHAIADIKRLIDDAVMPPFEGKYKVYLIVDAEAMLPVHANALLKTLEDKNDRTVIILTTADSSQLLPTIVSRCKIVTLNDREANLSIDAEFQAQITTLLQAAVSRNFTQAFTKVAPIEKAIENGGVRKLEEFIEIILVFYRDLMIQSKLATFEKINELTRQISLGYQRHIKIKTLVEQVVICCSTA